MFPFHGPESVQGRVGGCLRGTSNPTPTGTRRLHLACTWPRLPTPRELTETVFCLDTVRTDLQAIQTVQDLFF